MEAPDPAFRPTDSGPTALFLDTSGLFAYFHPDVDEHSRAQTFLRSVGAGEYPYRPLYTSTYVLDELATLLLSRGSHELAADALDLAASSDEITVLGETEERFAAAGDRFRTYDDHEISFTDCFCSVLMDEENVDHVFAYDGDYATFGYTVVPRQSST